MSVEETFRPMSHVTHQTTGGIVTPSKHDMVGRLKLCACGVSTNDNKCGVCRAEARAGISLRVIRKGIG